MPQARIASTKPHKVKSTTVDGVIFHVYLVATNVNVPLVQNDFNPEKVTVRIMLKRNGDITMVNTNMAILSQYSTICRNRDKWLNGFDLKSSSSTTKAAKVRTFKHSFRSCLHIKGDEIMEITVTVPQDGAFSANVDTTQSYVEFKEAAAIGYEFGVSQLNVTSIEATSPSETVDMGGHIHDIVILNFSENDLEKPVITNCTLSSHYFNRTFNFMDLLQNHAHMMNENSDERIGSIIPMLPGSPSGRVFNWLTPYPQSFYIFHGKKDTSLENAKLELSFNSENVLPSKNYVCYQSFLTDKNTVLAAHERAEKHQSEAYNRLKS